MYLVRRLCDLLSLSVSLSLLSPHNSSQNGTSVTLPEFEQVLKAMKMGSLVPIAMRVFNVFDNDKNGCVDMREIVCGLTSLRKTQGEEALRMCFKVSE